MGRPTAATLAQPAARRPAGPPAALATALAVAAMASVQTGAAISTWLFGRIGPAGTVWLRLLWAALVLLALARPSLRVRRPRDLLTVFVLGVVSGTMTMCYFAAIARIPLGTATALEFLGPLAVAILGGLRRSSLNIVWPVAAGVGVLLLTRPWTSSLNTAGILFAVAAGIGWGSYILLTQRVGDRFSGLEGLALSMVAATLSTAVAPGALTGLAALDLDVLLVSAAAALLLPILPYAFEMAALRRLTTASFGTLMSLEPAIGTVVGAVVLAQVPSLAQLGGIALVTVAGIGAAMRGRRPEPARVEPPPMV
jgi:inner membrane transporter RhtA